MQDAGRGSGYIHGGQSFRDEMRVWMEVSSKKSSLTGYPCRVCLSRTRYLYASFMAMALPVL